MKNNYTVRIQKLSKFHGTTNETFTDNVIHEEEYNYLYSEYGEALDAYKEQVKDCAGQVAVSVCFNQTYTVQLLDCEGTNPMKSHGEKRKIWFQVTMCNL
jgi:hypothetical protein